MQCNVYLEPAQCDGQRDIDWSVVDAGNRLNERHEEQREPDDADQQQNDQTPHPVLHYPLLLLTTRLRVPLRTSIHNTQTSGTTMYKYTLHIQYSYRYTHYTHSTGEWSGNLLRLPPALEHEAVRVHVLHTDPGGQRQSGVRPDPVHHSPELRQEGDQTETTGRDTQGDRQTGGETHRGTDRQVARHTGGQTDRWRDTQGDRQVDRQTGGQIGRHTGTQVERQVHRWTDRYTDSDERQMGCVR